MKDFFSPNIFVVTYIIFIGISLIFKTEYVDYSLNPLLFFYVAYGLFCFYVGTKINLKIKKEYVLFIILVLLFYYSFRVYSYLAFLIVPPLFLILQLDFKKYSQLFYFLGVTLLVINFIYIRDIPLFNPDVKRNALTIMFVCGYSLLYIGFNFQTLKKFSPLLFILAFLILFLYGYRSYILILILSTIIILYYKKEIKSNLWLFALALIIFIVLNIAFLHFTSQKWKLDFLNLIFYRISYTGYVLNQIVEKSGFFGYYHGLWLHPITGDIVGKVVLGYEHNTTSTILGPLILDFGIIEVPIMIFFGSVLGTLRKKMKRLKKVLPYYSILLSITLLCVDISPIPLIIFPYLIALYKIS
ncbi:MAG: oligosaccharide repeat unit polymerase [Methanomicrobia archaeon]|nr:oligosaccharide repeat unit polymerase [Methanomicrobia archaeon]